MQNFSPTDRQELYLYSGSARTNSSYVEYGYQTAGPKVDAKDGKDRVHVEHYANDNSLKERLIRFFLTNPKTSYRWKLFLVTLKLTSCVLYVIRTESDNDPMSAGCGDCPIDRTSAKWCCPDLKESRYWSLLWIDRPLILWILQTVISLFCLMEVFFTAFLEYKGGSILSKITMRMILETFLTLPLFVSIFWPDLRNLYNPLYLNCWIANSLTENMFNNVHQLQKKQSALMQKVLLVIGTLTSIIFTCVCGVQHFERAQHQWGTFKSLWFVVVTFSTVGYGDSVPGDWPAQTFVMFSIFMALIILPMQFEQLAFHMAQTQKEGGAFGGILKGNNRHVVVCGSTLRPTLVLDFLKEFYAQAELEEYHVVLLCPLDIDSQLRMLIQVAAWAHKVSYIKGSALNDNDLERARISVSEGVFILSDRSSPDKEGADRHTILRTWAIQDYAPEVPLYVQILQAENKFHVSFAEHVVCEDELKNALMAANCVCPGVTTLVTTLLHTLHQQDGSADVPWHEMFGRCAGNEIYDIKLGDSTVFRPFNKKSFSYASFHAHRRYGVCLIGVRRAKSSKVLLNPGSSYLMGYNDTCFYISMSSEEESAFKEIKETKSTKFGSSSGDFSDNSNKIMIEMSDNRSNGATATSLNYENEKDAGSASNGHVAPETGSSQPPQETTNPEQQTGNSIPLEQIKQTDTLSVGSSVNYFVPSDSDVEDDLQDALAGALPPTKIPEYVIEIPPISPYIGRVTMKCHLLPESLPLCCLNLKDSCEHNPCPKQREEGAIILASPVVEAGLYNFILPLRSSNLPRLSLKPIVLLVGEEPSESFLQAICCFPMLYYFVGSVSSLDDLLEAGILKSDTVVVTRAAKAGSQDDERDEEFMADALTIVSVQTIFRLFPRLNLSVELTHTSNMRFMKFDSGILEAVVEDNEEDEDAWKRKSVKKSKTATTKKAHLNYMFSESFADGSAFSASMIDTLLYQTFVKDYMIDLISLAIGLKQTMGSGYLTSIKLTEDHMWLGNYGCLYQRLCSTTGEIPVGMLRTEEYEKETAMGSGKSAETKDIERIIRNRMKSLNIEGEFDMSEHRTVSYVVSNPPPEWTLVPGDIIYVLRPGNRGGSSRGRQPVQSSSV
ncbi:potassium channel subfamily T member 1-like isoform X2 [Dendronephthya gigantea]|uniref:potassium channel subfamily T member 1-like isoform X2 n=1 Tax=Dendronephthya gigantea TaxID=151771 RepID=UPI00106BFA3C|nr:potassium channel subfamily T member 1-like isoform X2 [Dendronephthya gigantea]